MLTYVYHCPHCGEFEIEQSIKDEALTTCPLKIPASVIYGDDAAGMETTCGEPVKRLIGGGAHIGSLPMYMSDSNMNARSLHRDWLKTPEAKAMNLVQCKDG